ncbi:MAG TPA: HD-GYP domain-containing protein, partial [Candidatus Binataceae bacterium]|nr:HD-GYP domain-containing protein [Candidatus Binataceae bacterium]
VQHYTAAQMERAPELVGALAASWRATRFYPEGHPKLKAAVEELRSQCQRYLSEGAVIQLGFVEGEVMFGQQLMTEESVKWSQFLDSLKEINIGSLIVRSDVTSDELARALRVMATEPQAMEELGGLGVAIAEQGFEHLQIGSMKALQRDSSGRFSLPPSARRAYRDAIKLIHVFDEADSTPPSVSGDKIDAAVSALTESVLNNKDAMLQLAGMRDHDHYTYQHSANVAALSLALGAMISTEPRFLSTLGVGALLHDIGKLAVGTDIINKSGSLDTREWDRMRRHPVDGVEIATSSPGIDRTAVVAIAEHHVRFDGQGYPARGKARPQNIVSRIVAVADAYDAMTSRRSYSDARMPDEAMSLLLDSAGTSLDPVLVSLFVRLMGVYPPRSVVRLNSGEVGIVLKANPDDPARPTVRIVAAPSGHVIDGFDLDLAEHLNKRIVACIDPYSVNIDLDSFLDS